MFNLKAYIMKKILLYLLLLPTPLFAADIVLDGVSYDVVSFNDKTVKLTTISKDKTGEFVIPESIVYNDVSFSVISIGEFAFAGSNLSNVSIPSTVKEIGVGAFLECNNLTTFIWPESIETIEERTFYGCKSLEKVILPSSLKYIKGSWCFHCGGPQEKGAFQDCISLKEINLPEGLLELGECTFENCSSLKSITIPNTINYIRSGTFFKSGLESIYIPEDILSIGCCAFQWCYNLKTITIPVTSKITSIGYQAFDGTPFNHIDLPINLNSIGIAHYETHQSAIGSNVKSITLPNDPTTINNGSYRYLELQKIYSRNTNPEPLSDNVFSLNTIMSGILYVPIGYTEIYKNVEGWKNFYNIQEYDSTVGIESVTEKLYDTEKWYDLRGNLLMERPQKRGIFINQGQKVIVK